jgi:hypothetical protein
MTHPPYREGVGAKVLQYAPIRLPARPPLALRCLVGKANGSVMGDGITFRIDVVDSTGSRTTVAEHHQTEHDWTPLAADLSPWAGQSVRLRLVADVGPLGDSVGDWACWADVRIESRDPLPCYSLHPTPTRLTYEPHPDAAEPVPAKSLRRATSGTLHFEAIGLQRGGGYTSFAQLNGVDLGEMPSTLGREREGLWSKGRIPLSAQAVQTLGPTNRFQIINPDVDYFKIRNVYVELDVDGRRVYSRITSPTLTQPIGWLYAEGIEVPADKPVEIDVHFD